MTSCADLEVLLSEYADGASDPRTRRIVERHVQICPRCRARVAAAARVSDQLRRLPLLPPGVATRVARFRRALEQQVGRDRRRLEQYPFYVSAILAAALLLLTLLTIFYLGV